MIALNFFLFPSPFPQPSLNPKTSKHLKNGKYRIYNKHKQMINSTKSKIANHGPHHQCRLSLKAKLLERCFRLARTEFQPCSQILGRLPYIISILSLSFPGKSIVFT